MGSRAVVSCSLRLSCVPVLSVSVVRNSSGEVGRGAHSFSGTDSSGVVHHVTDGVISKVIFALH